MEAAKQLLEGRQVTTGLIYETFEREQIAAYDREMLIALHEIIIEEFRDEIDIRLGFGCKHGPALLAFSSATGALVTPVRLARMVWSSRQPRHFSMRRSGSGRRLLWSK